MSEFDADIEEIIAEEDYSIMDVLRSGYRIFSEYLEYSFYLVQMYGWQLLFAGIIFYYIFKKFLRPLLESTFGRYEKYQNYRKEKEYEAKYHKNPDLFSARISAQQEYAEKLQEKYNQQAKEYEQKQKEKEERKKQQLLDLLSESEKGHRLGRGSNDNKSFRPDYNPLMGPGPSSNYRPPKKSKCGGGGCGK